MTGPLFLHLLEGVLEEVEHMTARVTADEAELKRVNARIAILEAELAQIRSRGTGRHEEMPPGRLVRFFRHWSSLRGGFGHTVVRRG